MPHFKMIGKHFFFFVNSPNRFLGIPWVPLNFFRFFGAPKKSCGIMNMATSSIFSFFAYYQTSITPKRWNFYNKWYIHSFLQIFSIFRKNLSQDHSSKLSDYLYHFKRWNWLLKRSDPNNHHTSGQKSSIQYARIQLD